MPRRRDATRLRITRIIETWDMRKRHVLRKRFMNLNAGEVLLAFNSAQTIARFIDCEGGSHDYYAPKGELFDVDSLTDMVSNGIHVRLEVGYSERSRAAALHIAA